MFLDVSTPSNTTLANQSTENLAGLALSRFENRWNDEMNQFLILSRSCHGIESYLGPAPTNSLQISFIRKTNQEKWQASLFPLASISSSIYDPYQKSSQRNPLWVSVLEPWKHQDGIDQQVLAEGQGPTTKMHRHQGFPPWGWGKFWGPGLLEIIKLRNDNKEDEDMEMKRPWSPGSPQGRLQKFVSLKLRSSSWDEMTEMASMFKRHLTNEYETWRVVSSTLNYTISYQGKAG